MTHSSRWHSLALAVVIGGSCTFGPEQERTVVSQIIGLGDSFEALIVVQYERYRAPTGIHAFPDGGKTQVLEQRAMMYWVNAAERNARLLVEEEAPDSLWESFSASVQGLIGDTVSYLVLTGCPRQGQCYPRLQKAASLRVSTDGRVDAVQDLPGGASLPGVMLGRQPGEAHYVRFSTEASFVTARFDEQAAYEPIWEVRRDGRLVGVGG